MNELDPEDLALLDAARGADRPTASDRARVQKRLVAQLGAAALGLTAATTTTTSAAAGAWLSSITATKLVVAVALVGGIGAGGAITYRSRAQHAAATSATVTVLAPVQLPAVPAAPAASDIPSTAPPPDDLPVAAPPSG